MKTWTKKFQKMLTLILAICLVTGCMEFSNVQAATGKSGTTYYNTCINGKKGGTITTNGTKYYMSGTRKAICKGNTLTMYASFNTYQKQSIKQPKQKSIYKIRKNIHLNLLPRPNTIFPEVKLPTNIAQNPLSCLP